VVGELKFKLNKHVSKLAKFLPERLTDLNRLAVAMALADWYSTCFSQLERVGVVDDSISGVAATAYIRKPIDDLSETPDHFSLGPVDAGVARQTRRRRGVR